MKIFQNSDIPIYQQIAEQLKSDILAGKFKQGDYLPSIRGLAKELKISVITTMKAYELLEEEQIAFRMLAAKRLYKSEQEYICYVAEHPELFQVSQSLEERLTESEKMWLVSEKKKQIEDLPLVPSYLFMVILF